MNDFQAPITLNDSKDKNRYAAEENFNPNQGPQEPGPTTSYPDTLDEPILQTIIRDLKEILKKTQIAILPFKPGQTSDAFRNWDFWGPLIFCLLLGLILSIARSDPHTGIVFILIFVIVWIGGWIVSLNSQFLEAKLTIFQSICILGYCMIAIIIAALINLFTIVLPTWVHLIVALLGFAYSSYSSVVFVSQMVPPGKKVLVCYPIFLFYLFLAWFTLAK